MKANKKNLRIVNSISELHRLLGLPKPEHPLISVINVQQIQEIPVAERVLYNFYLVCMKQDYDGKMQYGQKYYDFDEGVISFISPGQVLSTDSVAEKGWLLIFHPDFIRGHPLYATVRTYGYFSYQLSEALFLSEKEELLIESVLKNIEQEYRSWTDAHSQRIMIAHIEVLLSYADRFYSRQFITRKNVNNDLLTRLETILSDYFDKGKVLDAGLPTVEYIAAQLHVSSHYLSDMLRALTGQNTQQHIQGKVIEIAKKTLTTTSLSVNEIAYQLGFKYPQSFNKLFKSKTDLSPLAYRKLVN